MFIPHNFSKNYTNNTVPLLWWGLTCPHLRCQRCKLIILKNYGYIQTTLSKPNGQGRQPKLPPSQSNRVFSILWVTSFLRLVCVVSVVFSCDIVSPTRGSTYLVCLLFTVVWKWPPPGLYTVVHSLILWISHVHDESESFYMIFRMRNWSKVPFLHIPELSLMPNLSCVANSVTFRV